MTRISTALSRVLLLASLSSSVATAQWAEANGSIAGDIYSIAARDSTIILGTSNNDVYQTTDLGLNWNHSVLGLSGSFVNDILMVGPVCLSASSGVYRSTDGGSSWFTSSSGLPAALGGYVEVKSFGRIGNLIFAATSAGVYVSADTGATWNVSGSGSPSSLSCLAADSGRIIAGTLVPGSRTGTMYLSSDTGRTWQIKAQGLSGGGIIDVAIGGGVVLSSTIDGVYRSTDWGNNWSVASTGLQNIYEPVRFSVYGNVCFGGTDHGIYASTNKGASWFWSGTGIVNPQIRSFAGTGARIYAAGTTGGFNVSNDTGKTWVPLNLNLRGLTVRRLQVGLSALYISVDSLLGIVSTTNDGETWTSSVAGFPHDTVLSVAAADSSLFVSTFPVGLHFSHDNGAHWNTVSSAQTSPFPISMVTLGNNILVACVGSYLLRSTDEGAQWSPDSDVFIDSFNGMLLKVGSTLFAATSGGVYVSADSGDAWHASNNGLGNLNVLCLASNNGTLIAGTSGGVFVSADSGNTWSGPSGSLNNAPIWALAVTESNVFAVVTPQTGFFQTLVYRSTDNCATWESVSDGLNVNPILGFGIFHGKMFVAGGGGVWVRAMDQLKITLSVSGVGKGILEGYALKQNYPNPFNPSTTIRFSVPTRSRVRVSILNLLGQQVAELANEEMGSGSFERVWNANVASGLYFYRIEAVSVTDPGKRFVDVKKMILLR
jgi:hypothetical protein